MGIYLSLKTSLKRLKNVTNTNEDVVDIIEPTEEEYYTRLFTQSADWNKPTPNYEEQLRWVIIENFMYYIKGYNTHANNKTKAKLLDLGCGRGWLSNLLSDYGDVTGIEPIKPVIQYAQTLFQDLNLICGTTKDLLADGKIACYDIIVCSEVIEHIPDDKKSEFLNEIKTLLKKNGFLIVTTPRKDAEEEWRKYSTPGQPVEDWLSEASLEALFKQASFGTHSMQRFSIPPAENAPEVEIYQLWLVQNN
ncbi:class I SAM-dependent methyltransferase [Mucilaginibacter sp. SP1R1]|uniref:class I SAM-dependent methyltransferase n=1 Tax=Mucilaginibacter sp. SP1R1 TaxID=2723091 RepID=UPI00160A21ED|nr:class I SAM-dependent methyltransferase [Mucilaginibacter sp. SP1R1]MBB6151002.1 2-polyprenyl-3-methyl-5-hydroxy-6-metoxy-1,4-benzoquinol methylase [Mucilaginibacter sp. SP1R1]